MFIVVPRFFFFFFSAIHRYRKLIKVDHIRLQGRTLLLHKLLLSPRFPLEKSHLNTIFRECELNLNFGAKFHFFWETAKFHAKMKRPAHLLEKKKMKFVRAESAVATNEWAQQDATFAFVHSCRVRPESMALSPCPNEATANWSGQLSQLHPAFYLAPPWEFITRNVGEIRCILQWYLLTQSNKLISSGVNCITI